MTLDSRMSSGLKRNVYASTKRTLQQYKINHEQVELTKKF